MMRNRQSRLLSILLTAALFATLFGGVSIAPANALAPTSQLESSTVAKISDSAGLHHHSSPKIAAPEAVTLPLSAPVALTTALFEHIEDARQNSAQLPSLTSPRAPPAPHSAVL
jgi:hypothetical protein